MLREVTTGQVAPIRVVAGVIEREGSILIARRFDDGAVPGLWEFPGGKVERGESDQHALARELKEELDVDVKVGAFITETLHHYPEKSILLCSYRCELVSGIPALNCHQALAWISPDELPNYDLSEADLPLAALLAENS